MRMEDARFFIYGPHSILTFSFFGFGFGPNLPSLVLGDCFWVSSGRTRQG